MSRPAKWSERARQKRACEFQESELLDALEGETEEGPEVPPELSTPKPIQQKEQQE